MLALDSQVALSTDLGFQIHAPARDSNPGHGCSLGVVIVVVLLELFRTKRSLSHHSWWRRRWVLAYRTFLWSVPNIYSQGQMLHRILLPVLSPPLRLQPDNPRTSRNCLKRSVIT